VFVCFVWVSEQTAIIYLYSINWLVCITETESVYCAVRTGCLEAAQVKFSFHCHVNAVMTGNSNCQYSASTCVGKRQGFPSFICRTAGCKSVCMRKVLRPTDRPARHRFSRFLCLTNAVTVPKIPSCYWMISVQPSQFKFIKMSLSKVHKLLLQISRFSINQKSEFSGPYCIALLLTILASGFNFHAISIIRTRRRNLLTRWCSFFL